MQPNTTDQQQYVLVAVNYQNGSTPNQNIFSNNTPQQQIYGQNYEANSLALDADASQQYLYVNPAPEQQIYQQTYEQSPLPKSYPDGYITNNTNQMASGVIQYGQIPRDPEGLKQLMLKQYKSLIQLTNVFLVIRGVKYFFFDLN